MEQSVQFQPVRWCRRRTFGPYLHCRYFTKRSSVQELDESARCLFLFWQTMKGKKRKCFIFPLLLCESNLNSNLQVIYRALPPSDKLDPFGRAAQHQLMVTNLRVRLLQRQPCACQTKQPGAATLPMEHYAIYDFIVKGSCLCNGHADHCVPARGYKPSLEKSSNMVSDSTLGVVPSTGFAQLCAGMCYQSYRRQ